MSERVALNADIVGYSRLMADDFDTTTAAVTESQRIVEKRLAENHGVLVDFAGDNFMAVFDDPMDAMRTSIAITTDLEDRNVDLPSNRQLMFRMGLDQGNVEDSEGSYFGEALNIAARIQSLAPAGGVSVSGSVYRALDEPELRFRPRGSQHLKNIPEPVEVYDFADLPSAGARAPSESALRMGPATVAVLPFHQTLETDALGRAVDVLRADLVHRLARIPDLQVIDAASSDPGTAKSLARYMIESGVHEIAGQVRVYSSLLDVTTMNVVKSHKWTVPSDELVSVSESLAEDVAGSIQVELVVGEPAGLYADLADPQAIEKVYLGWYHLKSATLDGWNKARQLFESVVSTHPESPIGYSLIGFAWWLGQELDLVSERAEALDTAVDNAQKAVSRDDPTGLGQMIIAAALLADGKPAEARDVADKVVVTRPTCDVAYGLEGSVRRYLGEWDQSVSLMDNAMRLSGVTKPWYPTVKACSLYLSGRATEASSVAESVLEFQPKNLEALLILTAAQLEQGLERRARAAARTVREEFPSVDIESWIDGNPYQNKEAVDRWKTSLKAVGLIPG